MPWSVCDTITTLETTLKDFLSTWFATSPYSSRMPTDVRVGFGIPGERLNTGIRIEIGVLKRQGESWSYKDQETGATAMEEAFDVSIIIMGDTASGRATTVAQVAGVVKSLFASRYGSDVRADLTSRGVYNAMESSEGLQLTPSEMEGEKYSQTIDIFCTVDSFIL